MNVVRSLYSVVRRRVLTDNGRQTTDDIFMNEEKKTSPLSRHGDLFTKLSLAIAIALTVTIILVLYIDRLPPVAFEGRIAAKDVRASQNYEIIDQEATNDLQEKATADVMPVYNFDPFIVAEKKKKIQLSLSAARKQIAFFNRHNATRTKQLTTQQEQALQQNFQLNLGVNLNQADYGLLKKYLFSEEMERALIALVDNVQKRPVLFDRSELLARKHAGIVLRTITSETIDERRENTEIIKDKKEDVLQDLGLVLDLETSKNFYAKDDPAALQKKFNLEFIGANLFQDALKLAPAFIQPNTAIDSAETQARLELARNSVQNVVYKLQKGQVIVRRGDRYEKRHTTILNGIRSSQLQRNTTLKFLGVFFLVLSSLVIVFTFAHKTFKTFKPTRQDLNFLGMMLALFLLFLRLGSFLGSNLQGALPFSTDMTTFYLLIPIAAAPMIVRFVLNPIATLTFTLLLSIFCGFFLDQNFEMATYYLLTGLFGAWLMATAETRSAVLKRSFILGLVNAALVLFLSTITTISTAASIDAQTILVNACFALVGGLFSALLVLGLTPIIEAVFGYTTNIQLLELASMNHPLLREMIVRAPGTYMHSLLTGTLAEAGTRTIGGNALLARVGCYYHDIGKLKKPEYFIENQKGENFHDHLTSSMSALIIDAHIKDGLDLAEAHKIPPTVRAFINEHQGTKLMSYFYHKAQQESLETGVQIEENDFRYKGPKPQSRESGVVMLADAVEAAVRSLEDKAPQKIQAQVEKLTNEIFTDGQLNECDLTLRDLHVLVDVFTNILNSVYHQRIDYETEASSDPKMPVTNSHHHPLPTPPFKNNIAPLFKKNRKTSA